MAKRSFMTVGGSGYPRASFWKQALGVDYYANGQGGEEPRYTNWWQGIDDVVPLSTNYTIYDPLAAADLASSYINLANPGTRNATAPVAAPTHSQGSGWTFDGSTQYLDSNTKIAPTTTIIIWVEDSTGQYALGLTDGTSPNKLVLIRPVSGTNHQFNKSAGSANSVELSTWGAIFGMNETHGFVNGNSEIALSAPWASGLPSNRNMFIGCQNSGSAANFFGGRVLRLAIYDFSLSAAQMKAVARAMSDYNTGTLHSYSNKVLALNPYLYYPCNEGYGSIIWDHSGNDYHGEAFKCSGREAGLYGNAVRGGSDPLDTIRPNYKFIADQALDSNLFSYSMLWYCDGNETDQVRLFETHMTVTANSPLGDYIALEVRTGNRLSAYWKEDGATQESGDFHFFEVGTWNHILFYNDLAGGVFGCYVNGTKYEFEKTSVVGITGNLTSRYPYMADETAGLTQHIALFDYVLTQEQVNTLLIT